MEGTARTYVFACGVLLILVFSFPAPAEDFKLGVGGGATFTVGDYADAYKTGWHGTIRALWIPSSSVVGVRAAACYGQNASRYGDFFGTTIGNSALYGGDVSAAFRLTGKGAEGLYANAGIGVRALRQVMEGPGFKVTQTDTKLSGIAGVGYSRGWFFAEANVVYFRVQDSDLWSIPVSVGFQF